MANYIDAREALPSDIQADICIIGGGAAGVTLAVTLLAKTKLKVVLLEAGSHQLEGATQQLYNARQTGLPYYNMAACRLRYFGGTTNHWGGYCRENDEIDYEGRPDLGVPAWPIDYKDVVPYVNQAMALMRLSVEEFDPAVKAARYGVRRDQLIDSMSDDLQTKVFQIVQKRRIHDLYGEALAQSALDIYLNANVTHLQMDPGGSRVTEVKVRTLSGRSSTVKARTFVLCTHAVENARLLLASNDVLPTGIGNRSDHVGRYFMEHVYVQSGLLYPSRKLSPLYNRTWASNRGLNCNLGFSAQAMRREKLMQYYCRFVPIYRDEAMLDAVAHIAGRFWSPASLKTIEALKTVAGDLPGAARLISSRARHGAAEPVAYELDHRIEQAPNPASRVTLGPATDALGVPEIVLHWELSELDYHTFARGQELIKESVTRLGLGRVDAPPLTPDMVRANAQGHYHHIGTTRMSARAADGVVDPNCRVHGVDNLYIGGSSIFTTAGYSGPTMMIVAFALRLAEHLRSTWSAA
jgi:choline dehydrogenase-like flavoprotein